VAFSRVFITPRFRLKDIAREAKGIAGSTIYNFTSKGYKTKKGCCSVFLKPGQENCRQRQSSCSFAQKANFRSLYRLIFRFMKMGLKAEYFKGLFKVILFPGEL
jgi:hypothetical protein